MRVRGGLTSSATGMWQIEVEKGATALVRQATFIRQVDHRPLIQVATKGARRFGNVTLAEEGSVRSPINDRGDAIEMHIALRSFEDRFDDQLFGDVKRTLDNAASGGELTIYDYRNNAPKLSVTREGP